MSFDQWTLSQPFPKGSYQSVAYGNGEFVAVGIGDPRIIRSQTEGADWTADTVNDLTSTTPANGATLYGVAWGWSGFVAVGKYRFRRAGSGWWTNKQVTQTGFLRAIAFGTVPLPPSVPGGKIEMVGLYVAVGDYGRIATSLDGVTWTDVSWGPSSAEPFVDVAFGHGRFVVAGQAGTMLTSPDGVTWTQAPPPALPNPLRTLVAGATGFVGVSITSGNKVQASVDGLSWTNLPGPGPGTNAMANSAWAFDTFVFVGVHGSIRTSPDGVAWTSPPSGGSMEPLGGVAYGKNRFVAVGSGGEIVRSGEAQLVWLLPGLDSLTPVYDPSITKL